MRVLFLDIDGVLAPWDSEGLATSCVTLLDELVSRARCDIVLTSSWREHTPLSVIEVALRRSGLRHPLLDATPILPDANRVTEMEAWLAEHPVVRTFVALDDQSLPGLEAHHVRTDDEVGLTRADLDRALVLFDLGP